MRQTLATIAEKLFLYPGLSLWETRQSPSTDGAFRRMDYNTVSIPEKHVDCWQFDGKSAVFCGTF
jgi:hypothetical protein